MTKRPTKKPIATDDSAEGVKKSPVKKSPVKKSADEKSPSPVKSGWAGYLRVTDVFWEASKVKTIRLVPESGDGELPFTYVPGQFINAAFWIGGARMIRSYSISSSPTHRDYLDLTVRREPRGAVSRHIVDLLKPGDYVEAGGPVGTFTFTGKEADNIVLISAGVGVTPMLSIARYLTETSWQGDIYFLFSCSYPADFMFAAELDRLQEANPKLHVAATVSRPEGTDWEGHRGRITPDFLNETVPDLTSRRIHICGPLAMMEGTESMLAQLGVPKENIKTEKFGTPKPSPAAAGTTASTSSTPTGPKVTFSKSKKSSKTHLDLQNGDSPPEQTVLELSEELGVEIQFSCRVGTCGVCKVPMKSGEVKQAVKDSLTDEDQANGIILACQAKPQNDITVEA
jgi:ferredoxin-NADP reductase